MKRHLLHSLCVWIGTSLLLTGCWDQQPIEHRVIITSIGIDKHPKGYEIAIQVSVPSKTAGGGGDGGGGGGKGGAGAVQVFSGVGRTLAEGLSLIQDQNSEPLFFGHTLTVLFGEDLAKAGIDKVLNLLRREPDIRRQIWPIVIKGKAKDALNSQTKLNQISTYYLKDMLQTNEFKGRIPRSDLGYFFVADTNIAMGVPVLNYINVLKEGFLWNGLALFRGDRMIDKLDKQETSILTQIRENREGWPLLVSCSDKNKGTILFRPTRVKRKYRLSKQPTLAIDVFVDGVILEKSCDMSLSSPSAFNSAAKQVEKTYEQSATQLFTKAKNKYKLDIFHIGRYVLSFYPDIWYRKDWQEQFQEMPISINYHVKVKSMGLQAS